MLKKLAIATLFMTVPLLSQANGFVGQWQTIDKETKDVESLVTIWEEGDELKGRVERIMDPASRDEVCAECKGEHKNQKIEGMTFIWGMEKDGKGYDNGKILDPASGDVYSASMKLIDNGQKLEVRGYIGFSLLGRSEIWLRAE